MKHAVRMLLILLIAAAAANLGHTAETLSEIEHSVIRLHILADSDETQDQTNKLLVRDALLQSAGEWIPEDADFAAGCEALRRQLPAIRETAERTLRAAGCQDAVTVRLEETAFPVRRYGQITLPAGSYQALRVEIGRAEGQNWWCVMYPAMCIPAASEPQAEDILGNAAYDMTLHPEQYEIRLKCVDAARAVLRRISSSGQTETASPAGETAVPLSDPVPDPAISSRSRCCIRSRYYCRSRCRSRSRTEESE